MARTRQACVSIANVIAAGACLAAPMLSGCTEAEVLSDYTLVLLPTTLDDQDPFAGGPDLSLVLLAPEGSGAEDQIFSLGTAGGGDLTLENLPTIDAGTTVGLLAQQPGVEEDTWDPAATVAYGQASLTQPLGTDGGELSLEVMVALSDNIGRVGKLPSDQMRMSEAVAMAPGGTAYLFGGNAPSAAQAGGPSLDSVLRLEGLDTGGSSFKPMDITLPEATAFDGASVFTGRSGLAVTPLVGAGQDLFLVTGGRPMYGESQGNTADAFFFDPVTEDWVMEGGAPKKLEMRNSRSDHIALPLDNGDILLYGGFVGEGLGDATFEFYRPDKEGFAPGSAAGMSTKALQAAAAPTEGGAIVCGGAEYTNSTPVTWEASSGCVQITYDGAYLDIPDLPVSVAAHTMTRLNDGRIMVAGGWLGTYVGPSATEATARAFVWAPGDAAWSELNPMVEARVHHAAIPLPDGRVMMLGGTELGGPIYVDTITPVQCAEVFDPATNSFSLLPGSCSDAGTGAEPHWASWPGEGAIALEGYSGGTYRGTAVYGLIGLGPDL